MITDYVKKLLEETEVTFMDQLRKGYAFVDDVDDYTEYWHTNNTGKTLQEFLGMTKEEYQQWGLNGNEFLRKIQKEAVDEINRSVYLVEPGDALVFVAEKNISAYIVSNVEDLSENDHRWSKTKVTFDNGESMVFEKEHPTRIDTSKAHFGYYVDPEFAKKLKDVKYVDFIKTLEDAVVDKIGSEMEQEGIEYDH